MAEHGIVEAHFLKCPHCKGRANLDTHRCPGCGAEALYVIWGEPAVPMSPDLVLVTGGMHRG